MAAHDWAIVVGIKDYADPGLAGLQGPENDARDFHKWVTSSDGGDVPKGQVALITSSDYHPPFADAASAKPTQEAIKLAFDHLLSVATANEESGLGRVIGDRLYLFFSGHGFAPDSDDQLAALLMANASVASSQLSHIIGSYMADTFWRGAYFKEVFLFMDCCRSVMECAQLYKPYPNERGKDFDQVRRFYAYGARVAKESREWCMPDGQYHGVFTRTLIDALDGAAADPGDPSVITAESLRDYLYNGLKAHMSPSDQKRLDVPRDPEVVYEQKPQPRFTVVTRASLPQRLLRRGKAAPTYVVTIDVSAPRVGKKAVLVGKTLDKICDLTLADGMTVTVDRGFYALLVDGEPEPIPFEVINAGKHARA